MKDVLFFEPATVAVGAVAEVPIEGRDLHVEVGFGKDIRILREARTDPGSIFLGIEISRKKCVKFCRKIARANLRNVYCLQGDVRRVLAEMLAPQSVASFTILFPDPWPKRRHHKHRWIQEATARRMAAALRPGGTIVVATDHDDYMAGIRELFFGAGLTREQESREIPEEDRSLFAERFERLGETVTYQRWRNPRR